MQIRTREDQEYIVKTVYKKVGSFTFAVGQVASLPVFLSEVIKSSFVSTKSSKSSSRPAHGATAALDISGYA